MNTNINSILVPDSKKLWLPEEPFSEIGRAHV